MAMIITYYLLFKWT